MERDFELLGRIVWRLLGQLREEVAAGQRKGTAHGGKRQAAESQTCADPTAWCRTQRRREESDCDRQLELDV